MLREVFAQGHTQLIIGRADIEVLRLALVKPERKENTLSDHVTCFHVQNVSPLYHRILNICLVRTSLKIKWWGSWSLGDVNCRESNNHILSIHILRLWKESFLKTHKMAKDFPMLFNCCPLLFFFFFIILVVGGAHTWLDLSIPMAMASQNGPLGEGKDWKGTATRDKVIPSSFPVFVNIRQTNVRPSTELCFMILGFKCIL